MLTCICRGVSEGEVGETIRRGASSVTDVVRRCGAGTGCGSCHEEIRALLEAAQPAAGSAPA